MPESNELSIDNIEIDKENKHVLIHVNPRIYPLHTVFSAAYVFIDRAYVMIDGDPNLEILVQMIPKDKNNDLERLSRDFNNELVNYAYYSVQVAVNNPFREAIIRKAFETQYQEPIIEKEQSDVGGRKKYSRKSKSRK